MISKTTLLTNLTIYALTHAIVDAACAAVLFSYLADHSVETSTLALLILLYNFLAFALQAPLGFVIDNARKPVLAAVVGCIFTAAATLLTRNPYIAVCLAGVGNALFHVGGGIVSLNLTPGKAAVPGIYVAPGAVGLLVGTLIGKSGHFIAGPFVALLISAALIILIVKKPVFNFDTREKMNYDGLQLMILLLLLSTAFRSTIGLAADFPWKSNLTFLVALTFAVALGKALGGVLADKFGWAEVSVMGLVASALLIPFGMEKPVLGIFGMFLFNMIMPVVLTAISNMFPGRAGFAFGLTTLALIIGALPAFTSLKAVFLNPWVILLTILLSAWILYVGLKLYMRCKGKVEHSTIIEHTQI